MATRLRVTTRHARPPQRQHPAPRVEGSTMYPFRLIRCDGCPHRHDTDVRSISTPGPRLESDATRSALCFCGTRHTFHALFAYRFRKEHRVCLRVLFYDCS